MALHRTRTEGGLIVGDAPPEQNPGPRLYWSRDGRTGSTQRGAGGDRYLITRWANRWLIHYIPATGYRGTAVPMQRCPGWETGAPCGPPSSPAPPTPIRKRMKRTSSPSNGRPNSPNAASDGLSTGAPGAGADGRP